MFFEEGDNAFLGEGWGDITLVFLADKENEYNPDEYKVYLTRRLYDIFALQKIIFQDFQVFRTELFFRPLALDAAKFDKKKRYSVIQSVRCRDDVNLSSGFSPIITSVEKHISDNSNDCYDLSQAVILNHIPGRNDIELSIPDLNNYFNIKAQANAENSDNKNLHTPSETLKAIHALTGAQNQEAGVGFEEIITRVGFKHDLKSSGS